MRPARARRAAIAALAPCAFLPAVAGAYVAWQDMARGTGEIWLAHSRDGPSQIYVRRMPLPFTASRP